MSNQLIEAARDGDLSKIKHLISQGVDVKSSATNGDTALHWAAIHGHAAVVELLVSKGADVKAVNKNGYTALHCAAIYGHAAIAELLVGNGADVKPINMNGNTPLHLAALNGNSSIVEFLVSRGAGVNIRNEYGDTAFHLAARNGHAAVVRMLKDASSKPTSGCLQERRNAFLALLNEDDNLRKRLGIRSDFTPSADYDVERLLRYTLSKRGPTDPSLKDDVEAGIAFHIETDTFVEEQAIGLSC